MAILGLVREFKASHGTKDVKETSFNVEVALEGRLEGDFVRGVDYDVLSKELSKVIESLDKKYLDDIVGRATIENIACYILFHMRNKQISSVKVSEDNGQYVSVFSQDIPDNYEARLFFNRGASNLVRRKFNQAIREFNEALRTEPNTAEIYNCLGRCHKFLKNYDLALIEFSRAVEIKPDFGEAFRNRGNIRYSLGQFNLMMADFNQAVCLMPFSALAYNNRGFAHQHFRNYEEAVKDHLKAIELDPSYAEAYLDLAKAYNALGQMIHARKNYAIGKELEKSQDPFEIERKKIVFPFS